MKNMKTWRYEDKPVTQFPNSGVDVAIFKAHITKCSDIKRELGQSGSCRTETMFSVSLSLFLMINSAQMVYPQSELFTTDVSEAGRAKTFHDVDLKTAIAYFPNCVWKRCFLFSLKKRSGLKVSNSNNPWLRVSKRPNDHSSAKYKFLLHQWRNKNETNCNFKITGRISAK